MDAAAAATVGGTKEPGAEPALVATGSQDTAFAGIPGVVQVAGGAGALVCTSVACQPACGAGSSTLLLSQPFEACQSLDGLSALLEKGLLSSTIPDQAIAGLRWTENIREGGSALLLPLLWLCGLQLQDVSTVELPPVPMGVALVDTGDRCRQSAATGSGIHVTGGLRGTLQVGVVMYWVPKLLSLRTSGTFAPALRLKDVLVHATELVMHTGELILGAE